MKPIPAYISRIRKLMEESKIDILISADPKNVFYLSGFNSILNSSPSLAILDDTRVTLLVNVLRYERAKEKSWCDSISFYGSWGQYQSKYRDWSEALKEIVSQPNIKTVGIDKNSVPKDMLNALENSSGLEIKDITWLLSYSRSVKSEEEIKNIKIASKIADYGMNKAMEAAKERLGERAISFAAVRAMNEYWISEFPDIETSDFGDNQGAIINGLSAYCLNGPRILYNCDEPTNRQPKDELVLIVVWSVANGYHVELERTVAIGALTSEAKNVYNSLMEIRDGVFKLIKIGTKIMNIYEGALKYYKETGFTDMVPGRIGHGIGLGIHESPFLSGNENAFLERGSVFTFEPNLRIRNMGGAQHSDTIVMDENGPNKLSQIPSGEIYI